LPPRIDFGHAGRPMGNSRYGGYDVRVGGACASGGLTSLELLLG
jgi:hypothetical protein